MTRGDYVVGPWYGGVVLMVVGEWTTLETPGGLLFLVSSSSVRAGTRPLGTGPRAGLHPIRVGTGFDGV